MLSSRLRHFATDAYKLSSLLLRHALLTRPRPTTISAFGETVQKILLDQSRPSSALNKGELSNSSINVVAVKLLNWYRELNLVRYHGFQDYFKQWWSSNTTQVSHEEGVRNNTNATVSLMITSEQRCKLSTILGYKTEDIRTLKPNEAHLLLHYGIEKDNNDGLESDYRTRLAALLTKEEKNKRSTSVDTGAESNLAINKSTGDGRIEYERTATSSQASMNDDNDTIVLPEQSNDALDTLSVDLQHINPNVDAAIPIEHKIKREEQFHSRIPRVDVINNDVGLDNINGTCWYEVIEKTSNSMDDDYEVQVVALFRTEKEAQECVMIKKSILSRSSKAEGKNDCLDEERYLVRRRWDL